MRADWQGTEIERCLSIIEWRRAELGPVIEEGDGARRRRTIGRHRGIKGDRLTKHRRIRASRRDYGRGVGCRNDERVVSTICLDAVAIAAVGN